MVSLSNHRPEPIESPFVLSVSKRERLIATQFPRGEVGITPLGYQSLNP